MSHVIIALIISLSFATWLYTKLMRSTGGNAQSAFTAAAIAAGIGFLVIFTGLQFFLH